jgi:hypothetical protein
MGFAMVACDRDSSAPDAIPLRFGEILSAAEMMPDFGGLPLERWPANRWSPPSGEGTYLEAVPSPPTRPFMLALSRLTELARTEIVAVFKRRP